MRERPGARRHKETCISCLGFSLLNVLGSQPTQKHHTGRCTHRHCPGGVSAASPTPGPAAGEGTHTRMPTNGPDLALPVRQLPDHPPRDGAQPCNNGGQSANLPTRPPSHPHTRGGRLPVRLPTNPLFFDPGTRRQYRIADNRHKECRYDAPWKITPKTTERGRMHLARVPGICSKAPSPVAPRGQDVSKKRTASEKGSGLSGGRRNPPTLPAMWRCSVAGQKTLSSAGVGDHTKLFLSATSCSIIRDPEIWPVDVL